MSATSEIAELGRAQALLRTGQLAEAEAACRSLLARNRDSAAALHLLGLIRKDSGDTAEGERLLRRSIELEPRSPDFHANLANLLRRRGRLQEATESYRRALSIDPAHSSARLGLARTLNDFGAHSDAEAEARRLVERNRADPQGWSALAMTLRDQNRLAEAEAAYRQALTADARHAPAHHNLGALYLRMEKAADALAALERARALGVEGFELAFNRGRALVGLYRIEEAEAEFARAIALRPRSGEAQLNLARLRFMRGEPRFARDLEAAVAAHPDDIALRLLLVRVVWRAGDVKSAESLLRDLIARGEAPPEARADLAAILHETGRLKEAETHALEAATARPNDATVVTNLLSILLAQGRPGDALPFIRAQRAREPLSQGWLAYEATAARMMGQPLYRELYDYERFVRSYDLEPPPGWGSMAELNAAVKLALEERHRFVTHPLDQSLRNGSQSAGSMLTDPNPAIRAIVSAFASPLEDYQRAMGRDASHPLTSRNTGRARLHGAWSVQLRRQGYHVNHYHPEGWISSAYYVSVPGEVDDPTVMSGWIKFGETNVPIPGAHAECFVKPRPGRLVLFPSYMWHGTNPIHGDDPRMTIAFDAVPAAPGLT